MPRRQPRGIARNLRPELASVMVQEIARSGYFFMAVIQEEPLAYLLTSSLVSLPKHFLVLGSLGLLSITSTISCCMLHKPVSERHPHQRKVYATWHHAQQRKEAQDWDIYDKTADMPRLSHKHLDALDVLNST